MQNPGSDAGVFVWGATKHSCGTKISPPSFRDAALGAGPESILTIVVMRFSHVQLHFKARRSATAPE